MNKPHISLTVKDFKTLVGGGIVKTDHANILLQDIGYKTMKMIINAMEADLENSIDWDKVFTD